MNRISWANISSWDSDLMVGVSSVKQKNRSELLKCLLSQSATRAELARKTKLSAPTVSRLISELMENGVVLDIGLQQTGDVGAPGNVIAFNGSSGYVIGVDIGESNIILILADLFGNIIDEETTPTKSRIGGATTVEQIVAATDTLLARNSIPNELFRSICVGVPGTVEVIDGRVLVNCPDISGWSKFELKQLLSDCLNGIDCYIENAQNLAVISEHSNGCATEYQDVVFIQIKGGIGSGILLNGELYRGSSGKAGEIAFGMSSINSDLPDMHNGKARHGSIEKEIGIESLLRRSGSSPADYHINDLPSLDELYLRAVNGNELLLQTIKESWKIIGMMSVNICSALNPQVLVLGGDIEPFKEELRDTIEFYVNNYCLDPCAVRLSNIGAKAAAVGSIQVACGRVYRSLGII